MYRPRHNPGPQNHLTREGGGKYGAAMSRRCLAFLCALVIGLPLLVDTALAEPLKAGDLLVLSQIDGTDGKGTLWNLDTETGKIRPVTDFGNPAQGPLGSSPVSVTVTPNRQVYVTDLFAGGPAMGGAVFKVNPANGKRTMVSNFGQGDPSGPLYYGLDVDFAGRLLANGDTKRLLRINPRTDERAVISDLNDPSQGATESDRFMTELVVEDSGHVIIGTARPTEQVGSALLRVQRYTGRREVLSDFSNAAQGADLGDLWFTTGMAIDKSGDVLVNSGGSVAAPRNLMLRVNAKTGQRQVLSDFDDPAQGPTGNTLHGIVLTASGEILVAVIEDGRINDASSILKVNPTTGRRQVLFSNALPSPKPILRAVTGLALVPDKGCTLVRHCP